MAISLNRKLALALAASMAMAGGAMAQTAYPTTPSTTPNDGSAVPPNRPVPEGQAAPAGSTKQPQGTTPPNVTPPNTINSASDRHNDTPTRQRDVGDNLPRTPAGGASPPAGYPNSGGSK